MKRLILAFALAASLVTTAPVVLPAQQMLAEAILPYGYYTYSDGVTKYTYLHSWPDNWSLVGVEPA